MSAALADRGPDVTTVRLARHGQTDWNATGRYHGQANVPLNGMGRRQALGLAAALRTDGFDLIASSPLSRAVDTANAVADARGIPILVDDRLREVDVGEWTGLTEQEVLARVPAFALARAQGRDFRLSQTGELPSECGRRVSTAVREIAGANPGKRILVVSHGYALQVALGELLGWSLEQSRRVDGLFNCALTELEVWAGQWRLIAHNVCHPDIPEQRSGEVKTV